MSDPIADPASHDDEVDGSPGREDGDGSAAMSLDEAATALRAQFTDARLLAYGRGLGINLHAREDVVAATALGLTTMLWRNTELENIHAGYDLHQRFAAEQGDIDIDDPDAYDARAVEWSKELSVTYRVDIDLDGCTLHHIADVRELPRLTAVIAGRANGFGIPDDVMMRANCHTAAQVCVLLDDWLDDDVTSDGTELELGDDDGPLFLEYVHELFVTADRKIRIGALTTTAADILGTNERWGTPSGWDKYLDDVDRKFRIIDFYAKALGGRRAAWYVALSGASYSPGMYPLPSWTAKKTMELNGPGNRAAFNTALRRSPWTLNGAQAAWVIRNDSARRAACDAQEAAAVTLARTGESAQFSPFAALI